MADTLIPLKNSPHALVAVPCVLLIVRISVVFQVQPVSL